jgi:hypothetical protein
LSLPITGRSTSGITSRRPPPGYGNMSFVAAWFAEFIESLYEFVDVAE